MESQNRKNQVKQGEYGSIMNFFSLIKNYVLFWVISPCITLPSPFQKRCSSFFHFGQVENIHGTYLKKIFLICFSFLSPQAEQKEDEEHFANHLQMYVTKTFTKTKKSVLCAEYPSNEPKILFIQIENIFSIIY